MYSAFEGTNRANEEGEPQYKVLVGDEAVARYREMHGSAMKALSTVNIEGSSLLDDVLRPGLRLIFSHVRYKCAFIKRS